MGAGLGNTFYHKVLSEERLKTLSSCHIVLPCRPPTSTDFIHKLGLLKKLCRAREYSMSPSAKVDADVANLSWLFLGSGMQSGRRPPQLVWIDTAPVFVGPLARVG